MKYTWILLFILLSMMTGCTSKSDHLLELIDRHNQLVEKSLNQLKSSLDTGKLSNGVLLKDYAQQLKSSQPALGSLLDNLALNATPGGPLFQSLQERLNATRSMPTDSVEQLEDKLSELGNINEAAHLQTFNDALSDPVNVVADLSNGVLPRIKSVDKKTEQKLNRSENFGAGSQLIGNPSYGQWVTGSNGLSFWEWYGIYALFSDLGGGRRYSYSRWSSYRPYSYYHDYGRHRYTKPSTYKSQNRLQSKTAKSFRQQGKKFNSPYAKQRSGASQLAKTSKSRPSSGSFRQASSYRSSASSSSRRGSSRTSRGPRRGK